VAAAVAIYGILALLKVFTEVQFTTDCLIGEFVYRLLCLLAIEAIMFGSVLLNGAL